MLISKIKNKGFLEIIEELYKNKPLTFSYLKVIKNSNGKPLSANTISKRLKEMKKENLVKRVITRQNKRYSVGYVLSVKGIKLYERIKEFNEYLDDLK